MLIGKLLHNIVLLILTMFVTGYNEDDMIFYIFNKIMKF